MLRANPLASAPPHLVLMARVIGLLSGITRTLGVRLDLVKGLLPYLMGQR